MDVFTESSEGRGGQISLCHCYSLSLSEVSEGAGSPARAWRPLSSLFSITGLFSTSVRRSSRVSSCDITAFTDSHHTITSLTAPTKVRWRRGEHGIQLIIIENRFCGAMGRHLLSMEPLCQPPSLSAEARAGGQTGLVWDSHDCFSTLQI